MGLKKSIYYGQRIATAADLKESVMYGAVKRIRPKIMTVSIILAGLIPIMFSHGTGADVMKRIAAPMVGGVDNIDHSRIDYLSRNLYDLEEQGFSERLKAWPNEYSLLCCKWSLPTTA